MAWGILDVLCEKAVGCVLAACAYVWFGNLGLVGCILLWTLIEIFFSSTDSDETQ
jgi:hypothetical protein